MNANLNTYVTIADKAFAMLALENGKFQSSAKYTKNKNLGIQTKAGRIKGWRKEGIAKFNKCIQRVTLRRKLTPLSDQLEKNLRMKLVHVERNKTLTASINSVPRFEI